MRTRKKKPETVVVSHSNFYWRSIRLIMIDRYDNAEDHKRADYGRIAKLIEEAGAIHGNGTTDIELTVEQRDLIAWETRT